MSRSSSGPPQTISLNEEDEGDGVRRGPHNDSAADADRSEGLVPDADGGREEVPRRRANGAALPGSSADAWEHGGAFSCGARASDGSSSATEQGHGVPNQG